MKSGFPVQGGSHLAPWNHSLLYRSPFLLSYFLYVFITVSSMTCWPVVLSSVVVFDLDGYTGWLTGLGMGSMAANVRGLYWLNSHHRWAMKD